MKTLAMNGINMSNHGWAATELGIYPLEVWDTNNLINSIIQIKLNNIPCPKICFDDLKGIPMHIMAKFCLWRSEWHHVNFRPCWFYTLDEYAVIKMTQEEVEEMKILAECESPDWHKPTLVKVRISSWKTSTTDHQYCSPRDVTGVVYAGFVYFSDDSRIPLTPEYCEIEKIYLKKTRKQRETFDLIRKRMRKYNIHC